MRNRAGGDTRGWRRASRTAILLIGVICVAGSGCVDTSQPLKMEAALRLDGPVTIQMQMQGPSVRYDGTFVSEDLYKAIEVDKTSEEWLLAALGEPDRKLELRDGGALLVWAYRLAAVEGSFVNVMDLGGDDERKPSNMTTMVRLEGGVVREKWRG